MRAASTGGGLVRLVVIWPVVLAALVMTAAGASSTSSSSSSSSASSSSAAAAAATSAAASAAAFTATTGTVTNAAASASVDTRKTVTPPPPLPPQPNAMSATVGGNATAGHDACELVRVSLREPPCTGRMISEGPGPPPRSSRCPADSCATYGDDNNKNNNNNNKNNNYNNKNNNIYDNVNYNAYGNNYNDNDNNINTNNSNHQCLEYARRELIPEMCPDDPSAYRQPGRLSRYRLRYCCHHTVESAVQKPYVDRESCADQVREALYMDDIAAAMSCQFDEVLARYDCKQKYSAKSCDSCKDAYALWACAAVLPHWTRSAEGLGRRYRVNACQSVCLEAEQKCPWLLPVADDANPYAGEASFTCIDPDIGYQMSSTNAKEDCCYEHCGDGLCVRNKTLCDNGGSGGGTDAMDAGDGGLVGRDQRPVCVDQVKLVVEESECFDHGGSDSSGGTRARPQPNLLLVTLLLFVSTIIAKGALMKAVVT